MNEYEQAVQFVQGLQAAGCCMCLTSLLALGQARGLGLDSIMEALDTIRAERQEAAAQIGHGKSQQTRWGQTAL